MLDVEFSICTKVIFPKLTSNEHDHRMFFKFIPIYSNIDVVMNLSENIAYTSLLLIPKHILNSEFNIRQYTS